VRKSTDLWIKDEVRAAKLIKICASPMRAGTRTCTMASPTRGRCRKFLYRIARAPTSWRTLSKGFPRGRLRSFSRSCARSSRTRLPASLHPMRSPVDAGSSTRTLFARKGFEGSNPPLHATFGEEGLDRLLAERTRLQLRAYRERVRGASDGSLESRVRVLATIRREQGYMAECVTRADGSLLLRENHCPICVAAKSCQGLCREELGLFRAVLGTRTHVERTDHIIAGASLCAYVITSTD
jgi:hypothetical protein